MSGHSKWSKIKHKKDAADQKRGASFTKLGNAITLAAKKGGDPEMNFSLRLAIDSAKSANLPKDNIERAIKRGTGELGGAQLEENTYEGFGPGKIGIIIETLTDNKNRTVAEIKHTLDKNGGSLGGPGTVVWMFDRLGILNIKKDGLDKDELELKAIDAGAEDIQDDEEYIVIYTKPEELQKVKENLEKENIKIKSAEIEYIAKEKLVRRSTGVVSGEGGKEANEELEEKLQKFFDILDENEDIMNYYTNV
ncbi:MAG: YebC/PmpR family DNA-binding transcriptional regulator [Patescibacteria group bacterium]